MGLPLWLHCSPHTWRSTSSPAAAYGVLWGALCLPRNLAHPFLPLLWPCGPSSSGMLGMGWAVGPTLGQTVTPSVTPLGIPHLSALRCGMDPTPSLLSGRCVRVSGVLRAWGGGTGGGYRVTQRGPPSPCAQKGPCPIKKALQSLPEGCLSNGMAKETRFPAVLIILALITAQHPRRPALPAAPPHPWVSPFPPHSDAEPPNRGSQGCP